MWARVTERKPTVSPIPNQTTRRPKREINPNLLKRCKMLTMIKAQITVSKTSLADTRSSNRIIKTARPRRNRSWPSQTCRRSWRIPTKIKTRTRPILRKIGREERGIASIRSHLESSRRMTFPIEGPKKPRRSDDLLEDCTGRQ